uniref:hydroxyacylglutathione hydrolase n=1 Tax=Trypanosoma congolense (strain IL3000) TaxID=1068625 RepID=G0UKU6_TRYCI|nr:putative hydroxyacylglutathione hydrolase [Trypanosoma congolense IL3000]
MIMFITFFPHFYDECSPREASAMEKIKQFLGPSVVLGGTASLYAVGLVSAMTSLLFVLGLYISGIVPENAYFPRAWYRQNIFMSLYSLYCSENVGYTYLRSLLHQRQAVPHSDYRHGVRLLSGEQVTPSPFPPHISEGSEFHRRGGGTVDLRVLGEMCRAGRYTGVVVVPVPVLRDNYAYFILSCKTGCCAVVDPADPALVLYMLQVVRHLMRIDFVITDILTTHKHWDHAGGNKELLDMSVASGENSCPLLSRELNIYGSVIDKPHACNKLFNGGDELTVADGGVKVTALGSPGHTQGSAMFLVGDAFPKDGEAQRLALFTGDSIFCGGCGALFEVGSVDDILKTIDLFNDSNTWRHPVTNVRMHTDDILLYVGHEYTSACMDMILYYHGPGLLHETQAEFAASDYYNNVLKAKEEAKQLRNSRIGDGIYAQVPHDGMEGKVLHLPPCTVPSTLSAERKVNILLSLKRDVLVGLRDQEFSSMTLQKIIYSSKERQNLS